MCLLMRAACGASALSEKDKTNEPAPTSGVDAEASVITLPPLLKVDEEEVSALTDKFVKDGSGGVPALVQKLHGNLPAADGVQLLASMRALGLLDAKDAVSDVIQSVKTSRLLELQEEGWKTLEKLAGPANLPALLFILETPRDMPYRRLVVQVAAMNALKKIAQREGGAIKFVTECEKLRHTASATAKLRMIEVLQKIDTARSRNMLLAFLGEPDRDVLRCALAAIQRADEPGSADKLQTFLSSSDVPVKKEAILALGRCKVTSAVPTLIEMIDVKDGGTRASVIWSLRNITGRAFSSTSNAKLWIESENAVGQERFATLMQLLKSGPPRLAPLLVEELGKLTLLRDKEISVLREHTNHSDFRVRAAVCDALGQTPPLLSTCAILIRKLSDPSDVVSASAWRSLKHLTGQKLPNSYESWSQWVQQRG